MISVAESRRDGVDSREFDFGGLSGEAVIGLVPSEEGKVRQLLERAIDPGTATESIHWGRNYLYVVPWRIASGDRQPVVVKQFRNAGFKARWRRRMRGTKAERSYRVARLLESLGVGTARAVLFADSKELEGPAYFLSEHLDGLLESRYLLRSLTAGNVATDYPGLDPAAVFRAFGALTRDLHDGRIWHRDLSCGNLLIRESLFGQEAERARHDHQGLYLLDLNRARTGKGLSLSECMRDLCRLEIPEEFIPDLWQGYWRPQDSAFRKGFGQRLRSFYADAFLFRNRSKAGVRGFTRRLADIVLPRRKPHAHIPATNEVSAREKIVWDRLSDQPHQHASKWEKLRVRLVDFPEHATFLLRAARAYPTIRRRYRELEANRFQMRAELDGFGVCVRPWSHDPAAVPEAIKDLGLKHVLLRLHPWQEQHEAELELAHALREQGCELAFSLPQDRSLVRDPDLWRARVATLAQMFAPLGKTFQVGQAINRSKWGVWKPSEYVRLFEIASQELRAVRDDVRLIGPAIIDFEFHHTAGYAFSKDERLSLDGLASLLYVDRRGAPENQQMGLDSVGKGIALRAIADTSPRVTKLGDRDRPLNWVTEVNWPLWEGPHSPAGRDVAVSEETQAQFLARYYLSMLASGTVDRVYWWQLIAKGYGLVDWKEIDDETLTLRRRPAFHALKTLVAELGGATFLSSVGTAGADQWLLRFERDPRTGDASRAGGAKETIVAGWASGEKESAVDLPSDVSLVCSLDGRWTVFEGGRRARLTSEVQLFLLA